MNFEKLYQTDFSVQVQSGHRNGKERKEKTQYDQYNRVFCGVPSTDKKIGREESFAALKNENQNQTMPPRRYVRTAGKDYF